MANTCFTAPLHASKPQRQVETMVVQSVKRLFCHPVWRFVFVHQTIRTHRQAVGGGQRRMAKLFTHVMHLKVHLQAFSPVSNETLPPRLL